MDPTEIVAVLSAVAQILKTAAPWVPQAIDALTSDDEAKLKTALADIQAAGDSVHGAVQAKLRGTASS